MVMGSLGLKAQDPVSWEYSSEKMAGGGYRVHMKASIQSGWHLYAQEQPKDAINLPTAISFSKNPIVSLKGKTKELGKKELHSDKSIGVSAYQYARTVDFVQDVVVKANAKTNLNGSVRYQVCTDEKCLPPKTVTFSVDLE